VAQSADARDSIRSLSGKCLPTPTSIPVPRPRPAPEQGEDRLAGPAGGLPASAIARLPGLVLLLAINGTLRFAPTRRSAS